MTFTGTAARPVGAVNNNEDDVVFKQAVLGAMATPFLAMYQKDNCDCSVLFSDDATENDAPPDGCNLRLFENEEPPDYTNQGCIHGTVKEDCKCVDR